MNTRAAEQTGEFPRARAARTLREWVSAGRFLAGQLLPTEQALCEQLAVSRGTVRAVLQQLEDEGVIQGQRGRGRLRGRVVGPQATNRHSLMQQTVVLATQFSEDPEPNRVGGVLQVIESGVADAVRAAGMHLFVLHAEGLNDRGIARLLADPPAGVAVGAALADYAPNRDVVLKLLGQVPVVVCSNDPMWAACDRVYSDHASGAMDLTRFLLARGCRRILQVTAADPAQYWVQARHAGYAAAMREAKLKPLPPVYVAGAWRVPQSTREAFVIQARQMAGFIVDHVLCAHPVEAIMAGSDHEAFMLTAAVRLLQKEPGKDILITGYDNCWRDIAERSWEAAPPLATVEKLNHETGEEMIRLLRARMSGKQAAGPQVQVMKPELMVVDA